MKECKKKKYPTKKLAMEALSFLRFKHLPGHNERGIYFCNICAHWHLTSQHSGVKGLKIVISNY